MLYSLREGWDDAVHFILFVARLGIYPAAGTKILDFGCGSGSMVFHLRAMGFDAYGFDVHDRVAYRTDDDRQYFRFARAINSDTSDTRMGDQYAIPFDNDTFDLLYSGSVLEHVLELEQVISECARVVKPTGMAAHFYPSMLGLVESHIYVPLATFFHPRWWLAFWAWAGVRNEFQTTLQPRDVVEANERYFRTGLRYYSQKVLRNTAGRYFDSVVFPPHRLVSPWDSWRRRLGEMLQALRDPHPCRALAQTRRLSVITCERKRTTCAGGLVTPAELVGEYRHNQNEATQPHSAVAGDLATV
jgi:SAM-dependent methyltransferase